jgi:hypothetical protein
MGHAPLPGGQTLATELSPYRIASLTKQFTSAATVLAMAERAIPLSTPAIELLPSLAPGWRADPSITVEQLLGQVAGLRESVDGAASRVHGVDPNAEHFSKTPGSGLVRVGAMSGMTPSAPAARPAVGRAPRDDQISPAPHDDARPGPAMCLRVDALS